VGGEDECFSKLYSGRTGGDSFKNLGVTGFLESSGKPFETFIKTVTRGGTSGLNELRISLEFC